MRRIGSLAGRTAVPGGIAPAAVALVFASMVAWGAASAAEPAATKIEVERVPPGPRPVGGLGSKFYEPSPKESSFYKRLAKDEIETGGYSGPYDIAKRDGKFIGWFGVVREIREDAAKNTTTLLVEQKYFDSLTDTHIMALSFDGSGDFLAVLPGTGYQVPRLSLVKVYGPATKIEAAADAPKMNVGAEFVRLWDWGAFTFLYAKEKKPSGNPKWRKLNQVELTDIYDPTPDTEYYEQRLGKR
jgi:hypothetical protein